MEDITLNINRLEDGPIRITLTGKDLNELGVLYFEKAKNGFTNKPITMDGYRCTDAKVGKLFDLYPDLTPKELVDYCQKKIKETEG